MLVAFRVQSAPARVHPLGGGPDPLADMDFHLHRVDMARQRKVGFACRADRIPVLGRMRDQDVECAVRYVAVSGLQIAASQSGLVSVVKTVLRIVDSRDRDAVRTPSDCYRLVVQQVPSHPGLFFFQ